MLSKKSLLFLLVPVLFIGCTSRSVSSVDKNSEGSIPPIQEEKILDHVLDGIEIPGTLSDTPEIFLKRIGYSVSYNKETLLPNWVAWHLTAKDLEGEVPRSKGRFHEDLDVPFPRATNHDYKRSGWSRGHMCPAADNKWNEDAMSESFLFTNICPQNSRLNSGDWSEIEKACRKWAVKYGDIYIVCGPILLRQEHETIGENEIVVPEAFFKVVLCPNGQPKGIGFVCKNIGGVNRKKDFYVNTIDDVERITNIDFFPLLPDSIERTVEAEADINRW